MKKSKAFTLIEMLVVLFIIALMATIGVILLNRSDYERKNNDAQRRKDINDLAAAIEEFKQDHGHYPFIEWASESAYHAYSALGMSLTGPQRQQCFGATDPTYMPGATNFMFGTKIARVTISGESTPCDDLSLQLLGRAYLTRMPADQFEAPEWITENNNPGDPRLIKYLDTMPNDPKNNYPVNSTNADYTPAGSYKFRYFYNSYYNCPDEAISPGSAYWINAIMQQSDNDDLDSVTGLWGYEIGTANYFRNPKSTCP